MTSVLSSPTVLVVDDNRLNRNLMRSILRQAGYRVDLRKNGIEAIEAIEKTPDYDVLIFDLKMPIFDGVQMIDYLSAGRPDLLSRVIIVSAYPELAAQVTHPVFALLPQPFTAAELLENVSKCVAVRAQKADR